MDSDEKYTRIEYERRFLIPSGFNWQDIVEPYSKKIEDKYIRNTRLRLRRLADTDTGRQIIKLNKKFVSDSPYFQQITRIILSPDEAKIFDNIEGNFLSKTRYYYFYRDRCFSIDVFEGELSGLMLCEIEADNLQELVSAEPPEFILCEVTEDVFFTGGNLCQISRSDLLTKLSELI